MLLPKNLSKKLLDLSPSTVPISSNRSVLIIRDNLPHLQALDAAQHIQVSCRILLYDIFHVIWTQCLFKLSLGHEELQNPTHKNTPHSLLSHLRTPLKSFNPHIDAYGRTVNLWKNAGAGGYQMMRPTPRITRLIKASVTLSFTNRPIKKAVTNLLNHADTLR